MIIALQLIQIFLSAKKELKKSQDFGAITGAATQKASAYLILVASRESISQTVNFRCGVLEQFSIIGV